MCFMVGVPCLATVIDGFVSGAELTVHFSLTHHWQAMYELVSLYLDYKCEFMLTIITFQIYKNIFMCDKSVSFIKSQQFAGNEFPKVVICLHVCSG